MGEWEKKQHAAGTRRGLVGDLLDAGRIDTGTLAVSPEPAEVAGLVDRARTTCLSAGGRHTVLIDLLPDRPRAMADRRHRLRAPRPAPALHSGASGDAGRLRS